MTIITISRARDTEFYFPGEVISLEDHSREVMVVADLDKRLIVTFISGLNNDVFSVNMESRRAWHERRAKEVA